MAQKWLVSASAVKNNEEQDLDRTRKEKRNVSGECEACQGTHVGVGVSRVNGFCEGTKKSLRRKTSRPGARLTTGLRGA